jgi:hypothetical protein
MFGQRLNVPLKPTDYSVDTEKAFINPGTPQHARPTVATCSRIHAQALRRSLHPT